MQAAGECAAFTGSAAEGGDVTLCFDRVLLGHCFAIPCQHDVDFADAKSTGALAQLGEHLLCKQGVIGSIPIRSTIYP